MRADVDGKIINRVNALGEGPKSLEDEFQVSRPNPPADVDDKIINRANALGEDPLGLAQRFITEFHADMVRTT